jgi:H+-transporting ATPase
MRMVLGISTVLGVIGVVAAFGLFYLGERVFHLDRARIQTLMYLKLSVAGHLTIFLTRTRGPFWSIRPAKILWIAVLGTQTVATLIAVYGLFMTPLGWGWAGFVWGYALLWFLVNDRIKLLAYRIFDPVKAVAKPESKTEAKLKPETNGASSPEAKAARKPDTIAAKTAVETKPKAETETKPEMKSTPDTKTKTPSDLTPQIAKRAYELYEREGHQEGRSVQDWEKAEREVRKDETKTEPKPEPKTNESKPDAKAAESKPDAKAKAAESKPDAKATEPKPDAKATEPKPDAKAADSKPDAEAKTSSDLTPQLVKRVHELYEQLGREEVRAVEDLEKTEREVQEHAAHK